MKFIVNKTLKAPKDAVWDTIATDFKSIGEWAPFLNKSEMTDDMEVGAKRICYVKDGSVIHEEVLRYDPATYDLKYSVFKGFPPMIKLVTNHWEFKEVGKGQTFAQANLNVDLRWWALPMSPMIRKQLSKTIEGFLTALEAEAKARAAKA